MAEYLIQKETLTSIADAIRSKTGEPGEIKLTDFSTKIQNITGGGSGVGKLGGMLLAGENGTYYPDQSVCFDTTYPFKASYTQEFLAPLYEEASAVYEFPMNDFATGAPLIDNIDAVVVIRFMLGENIYYYGLMKECAEPKFWVPVEVATALGYSAGGWYSIIDENTMAFAPSDIPDYPLMRSATFVIENEGIFELFDPSDFVGFSSVKVDMSTGGGIKNIVRASGTYVAVSHTSPITIEHNLGVTPDIIIVRMSGKMESSVFKAMTFVNVFSLSDDLAGDGAKQFYHWFTSNNSTNLSTATSSSSIFAATTETSSGITAANANTFTIGSQAFRHLANINYSYSWEVIGGITS